MLEGTKVKGDHSFEQSKVATTLISQSNQHTITTHQKKVDSIVSCIKSINNV